MNFSKSKQKCSCHFQIINQQGSFDFNKFASWHNNCNTCIKHKPIKLQTMKKIILTTAAFTFIFATAMFAQTGTAPAAAPAKQTTTQPAAKPAATAAPATDKPAAKKSGKHKGKAHPKK